jgi:hypothetical protein
VQLNHYNPDSKENYVPKVTTTVQKIREFQKERNLQQCIEQTAPTVSRVNGNETSVPEREIADSVHLSTDSSQQVIDDSKCEM